MPTMRDPADDAAPQSAKPFLEHLEDLRRTLIGCAAALAVGMAIAGPLTPRILAVLKAPLRRITAEPDVFLRSIEVSGAFMATLQIAFWSGLLLAAPIILLLIGAFVFPGLTQRERRLVWRASGFAVLLFAAGVALGYCVTLPVALQVMFGIHRWLGIAAEWTVTSYVAFSVQLLIAFGLVFEMPVVLLILGRLGVITSTQLREKRKYAVVILLIIAAVLTPPDVFSQILMAVPLILLYEICVWMIKWGEGKTRDA